MTTATERRAMTPAAKTTAPIRVLLVEDDDDMRWSIRDLLVMHGFDVSVAKDGQRALALIDACQFDVVLSDLRLPGASGLNLARRARAIARPPQVILITAYPDWYAAAELEQYRVLRKPLDFHALPEIVARAARP
ncbi:MAG: response regulator [Planctomycetota bacterium]